MQIKIMIDGDPDKFLKVMILVMMILREIQ